MPEAPLVSIIIPCRNEAGFISGCLDSVIAQDYPKDRLEVLVVDGMSEDGTRDILAGYAERDPFIRMVENRKKITPCAFNLGITHSRGDVIMIMGMHASYAPDYVSMCVKYLYEYGVDNVGGVMATVPRDGGIIGKAVAQALSHRFGVGNSVFRTGAKEPVLVDTVFGGCYRKEVFERVGMFNEVLTKHQDIEFNLRLRRSGGRILLAPDIVCYYYARSDVLSFLRHNFNNGQWVVLPMLSSGVVPGTWRHFVPMVFVTSLASSAALSLFVPVMAGLFAAISGAYLAAAVYFSCNIVITRKDWRYLPVMPPVFTSLHISYGLGSLYGFARSLVTARFWRRLARIKALRFIKRLRNINGAYHA